MTTARQKAGSFLFTSIHGGPGDGIGRRVGSNPSGEDV